MQHTTDVASSAITPTLPRLVGVPAAARDLGISPRGLWHMVARGQVRSVRLGRRVLIPRAELDRIVAEGVTS
jgi:excisionase family DNA binding protein